MKNEGFGSQTWVIIQNAIPNGMVDLKIRPVRHAVVFLPRVVEEAGLGDNSVWTDSLETSRIFAVEVIVTDESPNANTLLAVACAYLLRCAVGVWCGCG